jgi:hypothetical protein
MEASKSRVTDITLIAVGVGLMGLALLSGRTLVAGWSIIPVALVSIYLGARGWRGESKPAFMLVAGCLAAGVAAMANFRLVIGPILANIFGLIILVSILVAYLIPSTRQKLKL